jgi:serine/threonine protein kinase
MSALGTKAYAAPEIKNLLRNKTQADMDRTKEALTECVADYGMIVDAYSVGWTLRVVLTGIPPNVSISQYMHKVSFVQEQIGESGCLCFKSTTPPPQPVKVRDIADLPKDATLLIAMMTKTNPDERITVREAQIHPYIRGVGATPYELPQGDYPSRHGDPVVPLKCAASFSMTHSILGANESS